MNVNGVRQCVRRTRNASICQGNMSVKVRENLLTNSYFNTNCRIQHSGGDEVSEEFKWGLKMRLAKRSVFLGVAVLCTVGAYFKREYFKLLLITSFVLAICFINPN